MSDTEDITLSESEFQPAYKVLVLQTSYDQSSKIQQEVGYGLSTSWQRFDLLGALHPFPELSLSATKLVYFYFFCQAELNVQLWS